MHVQHPSPHHPLPRCRQSVTALILGGQPVYTSAVATLFGLCACLILLACLCCCCCCRRRGSEPVPARPGSEFLSHSHTAAPPPANMLSILRVIMGTDMHELWPWADGQHCRYLCRDRTAWALQRHGWTRPDPPQPPHRPVLHTTQTMLHWTAPGSTGQNSSVAGTRFFLRSNSAYP